MYLDRWAHSCMRFQSLEWSLSWDSPSLWAPWFPFANSTFFIWSLFSPSDIAHRMAQQKSCLKDSTFVTQNPSKQLDKGSPSLLC